MRHTFSIAILGFLAGCGSVAKPVPPAGSPAGATDARVTNVAMVATDLWNDMFEFRKAATQFASVTAPEYADVERTVSSLPSFPASPYSGCHARAELVYRALDRVVPKKAFKVWLFSGSAIAPALSGSIAFVPKLGAPTSWGYHVAAGFRGTDGRTRVVDTLVSATPLTIDAWLAGFSIEGLVVVSEFPGELYLFNLTEVPALSPQFPQGFREHKMARNVVRGEFWKYEGTAATDHIGARDIALDELSAALLRDEFPGCDWKSQYTQSLTLVTLVAGMPPEACKPALALYGEAFARWQKAGL